MRICTRVSVLLTILLLGGFLIAVECVKIAVIGGGISGLVVTKYAKSLDLDVTCFEQTNDTGGVWVYSDQTDKDKNGLKVHSAMYRNLRTNVPNQLMGFLDFDFKNSTESSYAKGEEIYELIKRYENHFGLKEYVKLEHLVEDVEPIENNQWGIRVKNLATNETTEDIYDAVFVCNGHYFDPIYPNIPGMEHFQGEAIHSHDYRRPEAYVDKTVLIIGAGSSGTDIANDTASSAHKVLFSHHAKSTFSGYTDNVVQKPDVAQVLCNGSVMFKDGSVESLDSMIFCTGYRFSYSFLSPECDVSVEDNHVRDLYKHVVNINHPTMFFIEIPGSTPTTFTTEYQTQFSLRWLLNPEKRLSKEEMMEDNEIDIQQRTARGLRKKDMHKIGLDDVPEYFKALSDFAEIPPLKLVYAKLYRIKQIRQSSEPITFRKYYYQILNDEEYTEEIKFN